MEEQKNEEVSELRELAVIEKALLEPTEADTSKVIALLKGHYQGLVFDVSTTAGMEDARINRRKLVSFRTTGDKKRLELNKPEKEKIDRRNAQWKRLETAIVELETPIDKTIKNREAEIEAEREKKREVERQRVAAIQQRIDVFRNAPLLAAGKTSKEVGYAIVKIAAMPIDGSYQELEQDAGTAREQCLEALLDIKNKQQAVEDEAARAEAERIEREKLEAAERERIRLKQEAEAKRLEEIRIEQEKAAQVERDRLAAEKAEQDRIAAEKAEALRIKEEYFSQELAARFAELEEIERKARAELDRQAEELKRQQEEMAAAIRKQQEEIEAENRRQEEEKQAAIDAENKRIADEEAARIAEEQRKQQAEGFDILIRYCGSVGWLGIKDDYITGRHFPTAADALKQVEKYLAQMTA